MKKKQLLLLLCFSGSIYGIAQSLSPSVLANDGGIIETKNMILEWTLGEPMIATNYGTNLIYTEGYHQPDLRVTPFIDPLGEGFDIQVFPNPVGSLLTIQVKSLIEEELQLDLQDLTGRALIRKTVPIPPSTLELDLRQLPSSIYVLRFRDKEGKTIQTFKISKIH